MTFKEYFDDKIDWKSFNYLLSVITTYEDTGVIVFLYVCVANTRNPKKSNDVYGVYYYSTVRQSGLYGVEGVDKYLRECYEDNPNFYYKIGFKIESDSDNYKNELKSIKDKIQNRFYVDFMGAESRGDFLVVHKK